MAPIFSSLGTQWARNVDGDYSRRAVPHFTQTPLQRRANLGSLGHILTVSIHGLCKLREIGSRIEGPARVFIGPGSVTVRIGSSEAGCAGGVTLIDEDEGKEWSFVIARSPQRCGG